MPPSKRYIHLLCTRSEKLSDFLQQNIPQASPEHLRWLVEFGAVYLNRSRTLNPEEVIHESDLIRLHLEPKRYELNLNDIGKKITFENEYFLIVNKPSGLPMHATLDNFHENLITGLERSRGTKLYITHRLDVPTSGLVVIAKTPEAQTAFNKIIQSRKLEKTYEAHVLKPLPSGPLRHWMLDSQGAPKEIASARPLSKDKWDECLLEITDCQEAQDPIQTQKVYKMKLNLLTGRTHQIRAQLSFEGAPIIGDEMYGGIPSERFGLWAISLSFQCPFSKNKMTFEGS